MTRHSLFTAAALLFAAANGLSVTVPSTAGVPSSSLMYGIMFEDINHSGDGGLYAELIQNRALQGNSTEPFIPVGGAQLALTTSNPISSAIPRALAVRGDSGAVGFSNPGWWGIDVQQQRYSGSFYVRGAYAGNFRTALVSSGGEVLGSAVVPSVSTTLEWTRHNFTITPSKKGGDVNNLFSLTFDSAGAKDGLAFNLISLFPPTYNNRPNGLRKDLMEALAGLKPSFLRFPGGNNLEGSRPPNHWKWNQTIGPLTDRPGRRGDWGYDNTDGLGLIEYMQWCDDLKMEPILGAHAGLYLKGAVVAQNSLQPYIDEFLNELEFLMGDPSTKYGGQRAALGYPKPWTVRYVEIGNEDSLNGGTASYQNYRFPMFYDAVKAKYPNMTVIASYEMKALPGDAAMDYHVYDRPNRLVESFGKFDKYDRKHKVLIGEYANIDKDIPGNGGIDWNVSGTLRPTYPWWRGAVSESVFMLGAERNGDVVIGASYAPLFAHLNGSQWKPDLILYSADTSKTVLSPSYQVIKLFSETRILNILPTDPAPKKPVYYAAGTGAGGSVVLKAAVYDSPETVPMKVAFAGVKPGATAMLKVLTAPDGNSASTAGNDVVKTSTTTLIADGDGAFSYSLPDLSVSVLEVKGTA